MNHEESRGHPAAVPYSNGFATADEPPAKRTKTLACLRCRRRKQKCDDDRPCANCVRSGEECQEAPARTYWPSPAGPPNGLHPPLALLGDLASLEERVSHLERTRDSESLQPSPYPLVPLAPIAQPHTPGLPGHPENSLERSLGNVQIHQRAPSRSQGSRESRESRESRVSSSVAEDGLGRTSTVLVPAASGRSDTSCEASSIFHEPFSMNRAATQSLMQQPLPPDVPCLDEAGEATLFDFYDERVQRRYPFLRLQLVRDVSRRQDASLAFFANMVFSISLLLGKRHEFQALQARHEDFYQAAIVRYFPQIFSMPDRIVHIQAYLLLAMHALYSPSTEKLISITSIVMRYCIMGQLHLADAEPRAETPAAKVEIQMRRRVFWSAYGLDRAVGTMFHLPFCIPDYQITTKMYANVDEKDLYQRCEAAFPDDPHSQPAYTNISAALHIVYCRQIQSEILNTTLHRDFEKDFDKLSSWRRHILEKLDRWKSLCHRYTEDGAHLSLAHVEWLHIVYNYSLLMLYQPNRQTVMGPAGDWTVKACIQTILIFRKFQRESAISVAWMGLLAQFKSGVALLYCFWATQGQPRSVAFDPAEASEAVRCCSIILSLLAERWPSTKCLRDAFDILAREIPLVDVFVASPGSRQRAMRPESCQKLMALLAQIEAIVIHRDTLRMVREMATQALMVVSHERPSISQMARPEESVHKDPAGQMMESDESPRGTAITGDLFQPVTPHFLTLDTSNLEPDNFDYSSLGFPGLFDPST